MSVWHWAWLIGVYLAVLSCVIAIIRIGLLSGWNEGLKQVLVFVGFAFAYWFLESWAIVRAPFYLYPPAFPDMIPFFPFPSSIASSAALAHPCAQMPEMISASIPLSAAVITFTLMWTARLLLGAAWLMTYKPNVIALSVGTSTLFLDLSLDPVLALSKDCMAKVVHPGLGFWHWYTDPSFADFWFRIPLYNFASWYAAPALLVAVVILIAGALAITTATDMLLRGLIVFLVGAIFFTAPGANPPIPQIMLVLFLVLVGLYHLFKDWSTYIRNNPFRWELILPLLFFFLYPLVALLLSGTGPLFPLLIVSAVVAAVGAVYTFTPYVKWP